MDFGGSSKTPMGLGWPIGGEGNPTDLGGPQGPQWVWVGQEGVRETQWIWGDLKDPNGFGLAKRGMKGTQ